MAKAAKPLTKSRPLTYKETKLIQGIVQGKTKRQAAVDAGYGTSPTSAASIASETLSKPNVQEAMMSAMTAAGIDAALLARTIKNGLTATKGIIVRDPGAVDTDESKNSAFYEEVPDHAVRHRYLETSLKIAGVVSSDAAGITNNFIYVASNQTEKYGI